METLIIRSKLERFILVDGIDTLEDGRMAAFKYFDQPGPAGLLIEAMAQTGAMHARFLLKFEMHVFLLKVKELAIFGEKIPMGRVNIEARLSARSDKTFSHEIAARSDGQKEIARGGFLFSALAFDESFREDELKNHYQRIFTCLRKNTDSGC